MFDFSFPELLVVCVVALVVLGPTRLPGLVRKIGRWVGKARSMARDFREQLENEVNVEELNRAARQQVQSVMQPFEQPTPPAESGNTAATSATMADSGYPYGTQTPYGTTTEMSSTSADPAVTSALTPDDDAYSHAHAHGAAPQAWSPEPEEAQTSLAPAPEQAEAPASPDPAVAHEPAPHAADEKNHA